MFKIFRRKFHNSSNIFEVLSSNLKQTFFDLDDAFHATFPELSLTCGATFCGVLLLGDVLISFNLGDCRAIVVKTESFIRLTNDHTLERSDEKERVERAGGKVINGKINDQLIPSRFFGQFQYKERIKEKGLKLFKNPENAAILSCVPEISVYFINQKEDELLVLYTDGFYHSFQEERMLRYIQSQSRKGSPKEIEMALKSIFQEGEKINTDYDNSTILLLKIPSI